MPDKNPRKALAFALVAVLFWSTVSTAFKIALGHLDFMQLLFLASVFSSLAIGVVVLLEGKGPALRAMTGRQWALSAFLGLLNPFAYYLVLLKAYSLLPAQVAQPLNYTWPVVLVLLSAPLLGQRLHPLSLLAALLSFGGVLVISTQGQWLGLRVESPLGVGLAVGSSVIWALFWLLGQRDQRDESVKLLANFLFGALYSGLAVLLFSEFSLGGPTGFWAALYVGLMEMGITFVLWMKALRYAPSNAQVSNLVFLSPFLALLWISLILGERLHATTFAGLLLIMAGVYVQQRANRKAARP